MRLLVVAAASLSVAGCALGSGVVPAGPGVFTVSAMRAPVRGGGAAAQAAVLDEATAFCGQGGRQPVVLDLRPGGDPRIREWPTAFGLLFRCA